MQPRHQQTLRKVSVVMHDLDPPDESWGCLTVRPGDRLFSRVELFFHSPVEVPHDLFKWGDLLFKLLPSLVGSALNVLSNSSASVSMSSRLTLSNWASIESMRSCMHSGVSFPSAWLAFSICVSSVSIRLRIGSSTSCCVGSM